MGFLLLVVLFPFLVSAQGLITGHVLSKADQSPIPAATIQIKGTRTGVSSNLDGKFEIRAKQGDVLVVSGIGITRQEVPVGSNNDLSILVELSSRNLTEVVVTASGIRKETKRLGYAIQDVKASDLVKAREPDPINSLKGNVAGLSINITPEIGRSPDVIMRGEGRPIFVVDGVPVNSDTYNINPDDVESFTILKGPNAAALYGFQGRDGAIIINTKKGSRNKRGFSVDFNSSTQFSKGFIALPKYQDDYGAGEYGSYAFGDGNGGGVNDYDYDVWGPKFKGQLLPQYDGKYDATKTYTTTFENGSTYQGHIVPTPWVARGRDNLKRFIQTGLLSSNSLSLSSSSEKADIRLSAGNTYQKGIVPNTSLNNGNFTGSVGYKVSDKFTINSYFNYSRQSTPNIPDVNYGPNSIIYNILIWGGADWSMDDMRDYWQPGKVGIQEKYAEYYRYNNPYFMSYEWLRGHYVNNIYGYTSLNYKVNDNIDVQFRPSLTGYDMFNSEKLPYSATVYGRPEHKGDYREDRRSLFESNVELLGKYHRNNILGFLDVQGLIGGNVRSFRFNSDYTSTNYLNVPGIYAFSNSLNPVVATSYNSEMKVLSGYYSVDLGYKSYVTAGITGRFDKSSSLPANNNTYFYPSFNIATAISDYVKLPEVISFLKLRASYAQSKDGGTSTFFYPANIIPGGGYGFSYGSPYGGPNYQFSQTYTLSPTYNNVNSAQYTDAAISSNIQTQDRKAYEFGADIRLLKNRIALDVTRYHYKNGPNIVYKGVSSGSGYSSYLTNGGIYTNDGWEATATGAIFRNPNGFSWDVTANFSTYIRKWVDNANPDNYAHNGTRYDLVYDNAFVRTPDGKLVHDGVSGLLLRFKDLGVSAKKVYGHADPDWQWGVINTLKYKGLSFRFQFDGLVGGVMEDYVRKKTLQGGRHIETIQGKFGDARPNDATGNYSYVGDGVVLSGGAIQLDPVTGQITNIKNLTVSPNTVKTSVQDYVSRMASIPDLDIIKKTYVKLREVTISYTLPDKLLGGGKRFFQQATVSAVGRNLLYFFPDRYKDVDVDQYTLDRGSSLQTPTTRSFGFNISLTF